MNSDLAYGTVKKILFYNVLYVHCFEGTDNNKCHSYDVQNICIFLFTKANINYLFCFHILIFYGLQSVDP